ncbi:MAG TPA: hypothetical protein VGQ93_13625 [Lysobacter sp.]|jgi:uncharacterized low-complexity protein|nr:hypothetical protein [Lysobacter sp.]
MSKQISKPLALAVGAALVGGVALSASAFAMTDLASGYMVSASHAGAEAKCGADKKAEGSCGNKKTAEATCGADKKAEGSCGASKAAKAEGKCGEGNCGGKMFEMMDSNKDGMVSRAECDAVHDAHFKKMDANGDGMISRAEADAGMKAMNEGKCGEGKCGGMA